MSTLYLSSDPRSLAERLALELDRQAKDGDFFVPATVVVPNRYLRKWLRLTLARRLDVAINLRFLELDDALWQLLQKSCPQTVEPIDENLHRLMVLSALLQEDDSDLEPLRRYLQLTDRAAITRLTCRRAWYLADRLGLLLRDYETHRQDDLIQPWLNGQLGLSEVSEFHAMMERAQRALFRHMTREPDGKRALLDRHEGAAFKTLPQLALECMAGPAPKAKPSATVHLFGFTHLADMHVRALAWLGERCDIKLYHLNAIANRADRSLDAASLRSFAARWRDPGAFANARDPGMELMRLWGRAGAESLSLIARLLDSPAFHAEWLPVTRRMTSRPVRRTTVLARLHDHLLGASLAKTRVAQDTSLQIVGCPGAMREVQTVYHSILDNLHRDPELRQTDIAVLVTDMAKYRPCLQAVFERPPMRLTYNLVDYSAASTSVFGQALLGMLDLALDSFSRSRVFQVILNPCFLARLGADRSQALAWLEWADALGIYQGWDADEKHAQGYPRSPFYAWRLGLQRLRLGRYMDCGDENADGPAPRFGHVIPFADLASSDRDQLDRFCMAVEGLLPTLAKLRSMELTGERWASALDRLVQEFLAVPIDRPEEEKVRDELLASLRTLSRWDALQAPFRKAVGMPLTLVREYVQSQLNDLQGSHGEYLTGGVTISELQPMRPVPFTIVFVLGLGDDLFPGSNALSSFDLRGARRVLGDMRPAEQKQFDFVSTVLSAQQKLYLFYSNHDLQKDQVLLPAVPLLQLQRHLGAHVVDSEFKLMTLPTDPADVRYVDARQQPAYQDVLVQYREADRCLTLRAAEQTQRLALDLVQQTEWVEQLQRFQQDFTLPPVASTSAPTASTVTLSELKRFLNLPAYASLRRHLRIDDDDESEEENDEPLVTPQYAANALMRQTLDGIVLSMAEGRLEPALSTWQDRFTQTYADSRMRSQVPEEAFGEIDQSAMRRDLVERIHGQGQIESFLRQHANLTFCGPILVGESMTPIGARLRFPALRLLREGLPDIRVIGSTPFAWQSPDRVELLVVTNYKTIDGRKIAPALLDPLLLLLAMHANAEPNTDGIASQTWLAPRDWHIHVAHCGGIQTWIYPAGAITSEEARQYFVELTRDFLDPTQFDLLPFDLVQDNFELARACDSNFSAQMSADNYYRLLEEKVSEIRDNPYSRVKIPQLVKMVQAQVPIDALAKIQRRFRLLDRGPARVRQQPTIRKRARLT
jgi:exodeoxyribonuclease V gamma subunit